jgi:hypothetical protein
MGVRNSKEKLFVKNELTGRYEKRTPGKYYPDRILPDCKFKIQVKYGLLHELEPGDDPVEVKLVKQSKTRINKYLKSTEFKTALNMGFQNAYSYYGLNRKYSRFEVTRINLRTQTITIHGDIVLVNCMNIEEFTRELTEDIFDADWLLNLDIPNTKFRVQIHPWYYQSNLLVNLNCV